MTSERVRVEGLQAAPPTRQSRSVLAGCLGLLLFLGTGMLSCGGLSVIAKGEGVTPAIYAMTVFMFLCTALGAVAVYWGFSKKSVPTDPNFDEAKRVREAVLGVVDTGAPRSQAINAAAALLLDKRYEEAIAAYRAVAEAYPEERGTAFSQIGAACYFLGRYAEAIQWYEQAAANGASPEQMRENIEEARAALR
jgi:hypothetical protein